MKRKSFLSVALFLALILALFVAPASANWGCFPSEGSSDVKYYQSQEAAVAVGVTSSCVSERAVFHSDKVASNLDVTTFGAFDHVGCLGVLGVTQVNVSADTTRTTTCGSYDLHQQSTVLNNAAQMQQLGGVAATAQGAANASGAISQTQHLTSFGVAHLPGGFAMTSYCGTQTASASASAK